MATARSGPTQLDLTTPMISAAAIFAPCPLELAADLAARAGWRSHLVKCGFCALLFTTSQQRTPAQIRRVDPRGRSSAVPWLRCSDSPRSAGPASRSCGPNLRRPDRPERSFPPRAGAGSGRRGRGSSAGLSYCPWRGPSVPNPSETKPAFAASFGRLRPGRRIGGRAAVGDSPDSDRYGRTTTPAPVAGHLARCLNVSSSRHDSWLSRNTRGRCTSGQTV